MTTTNTPGKFERCENQETGRKLYELAVSGADDEVYDGDASYFLLLDTDVEGVKHAIVRNDDQGFVTYDKFDTGQLAARAFEEIKDEIDGDADFEAECDDRYERELDGDLIDGVGFADPGGRSALRAATPDNPRDQPCPTCGAENVLTPADVARGYQCDRCADRAEGTYFGADY